ncbi:MAG TPA: ABC transporter substrate-binding protein [Candidatus Sulfotelmatobacter sp.]|nr:ABC transporter substrate-binding protein [Candidatus Sulfotelmatobacter sp.]
MKHFAWRWLVVSSAMIGGFVAGAETRPQYGGTLRVEMRAAPMSLDPADSAQPDSIARRNLTILMFDTLVTSDENGRLQASLAASWQVPPSGQRWQFHLRRGVKFHDGTALTAELAAASLRTANRSWNVSADADSVIIELDGADPELPAELALSRNAIVKRTSDGKPSGTGPFHITDWQPGKKLTLAAEENYWHGRPFLDGIEIEMGKSSRDQLIALEMGKADLVEVASEQSHRVAAEGRLLATSAPIELLALVFTRAVTSSDEKLLREALALSVERGSIRNVLLQGAGQPAASMLPNWLSGYAFVFPTDADLPRARHTREPVHTIPTWTLAYDSGDPVARLLAERIALNAKDAGLSLQPTIASSADLRLARIPLASTDAWIALLNVAAKTGVPAPKLTGSSIEDIYSAEQTELAAQRVIPLFHLPVTYAVTPALKNWRLRLDGSWSLADAWLGIGKP